MINQDTYFELDGINSLKTINKAISFIVLMKILEKEFNNKIDFTKVNFNELYGRTVCVFDKDEISNEPESYFKAVIKGREKILVVSTNKKNYEKCTNYMDVTNHNNRFIVNDDKLIIMEGVDNSSPFNYKKIIVLTCDSYIDTTKRNDYEGLLLLIGSSLRKKVIDINVLTFRDDGYCQTSVTSENVFRSTYNAYKFRTENDPEPEKYNEMHEELMNDMDLVLDSKICSCKMEKAHSECIVAEILDSFLIKLELMDKTLSLIGMDTKLKTAYVLDLKSTSFGKIEDPEFCNIILERNIH